jgi:hypothetical protein
MLVAPVVSLVAAAVIARVPLYEQNENPYHVRRCGAGWCNGNDTYHEKTHLDGRPMAPGCTAIFGSCLHNHIGSFMHLSFHLMTLPSGAQPTWLARRRTSHKTT